jgi:hypothetical protein
MNPDEPSPAAIVLDPYSVLRTLVGTTAYVVVTFGPGSEASGSVVAIDHAVSVLVDRDGAAAFIRHDAIQAVTVRDALTFAAELGIAAPGGAAQPGGGSFASAASSAAATAAASAPAPEPAVPTLGLMELQQMLVSSGFDYDRPAVERADVLGRTGLATLAAAVAAALQSIQADPVADAGMNKDITAVRLVDGDPSSAMIDGTTLIVTSPWTSGPGAVYAPGPLREDILAAAS